MINIFNPQGNANQKYVEIHLSQDDSHQENKNQSKKRCLPGGGNGKHYGK
jgi:hypothetical protein